MKLKIQRLPNGKWESFEVEVDKEIIILLLRIKLLLLSSPLLLEKAMQGLTNFF